MPVSIKLVSFDAVAVNNKALLQWTTTNEINTGNFIIERSRTGISYTSIGKVSAFNTPNNHSYSFTDESKLSNIVYYRLRMVDRNGDCMYSDVKVIRNISRAVSVVTDTAKNCIIVTYPVAGENAFIKVVDMKGREMILKKIPAQTTSLVVNTAFIAKGEYQLLYTNGAAVGTVKFIKQ